MLAAFEAGIDTPPGSHMAVWRFLLVSDQGASVLHRHDLIHAEVARDAVRVLLGRDSGDGACDLALAVLRHENVSVITDDDLITIADRVMDEGKARRLTWLIEQAHELRGLGPEYIVALRDRLAGSELVSVRVAAVEVGALLPRLDEHFAMRMLADGAAPVRTAVAELLEKTDAPDKPLALAIVRQQLDVERHRTPLSALHHAMGSMIRSGGRRVRMWEPPTGGTEN